MLIWLWNQFATLANSLWLPSPRRAIVIAPNEGVRKEPRFWLNLQSEYDMRTANVQSSV